MRRSARVAILRAATWAGAIVLSATLAVGCAGDDELPPETSSPPRGDAAFGERCSQTEDCESLLCVRVDEAGGVCTDSCRSDEGCPQADNWACLSTDRLGIDVCACRKFDTSERCNDGLDNDCDGRVDDCRMCDGTAVANDDPAHCGGCNRPCRPEQRCSEQRCECPEDTPDDCGICVATLSDVQHCGRCGTACGPTQSCVDGECVCPDEALGTYCENAGCVDLATDLSNCGECGNGCPGEQSCVDGECACPVGQVTCDGGSCVDVEVDTDNCGACGAVCGPGLFCNEGRCECPSSSAPDFCEELGCVDLQSDERHCGRCARACPEAQACIAGECGCESPGTAACDAECVDLRTNSVNCGACGIQCPGGTCVGGECWCESGVVCDGVCAPQDDRANCGACGRACPEGMLCSNADCVCEQPGLEACDGACFDLNVSSEHCGDCGIACTGPFSCVAGRCRCPEPTVGEVVRVTSAGLANRAYGVAWSGTHVGVVYVHSVTNTENTLRFLQLNPDGSLASDAQIGGDGRQPDLVWTGSEYGVVWVESVGSRFLRLDATGAPKGVATGGLGAGGPVRTTVAWSSTDGAYAIGGLQGSAGFFRLLGADASAPAAPTTFLPASGVEAAAQIAAAPGGGWALAFGAQWEPGLALFNSDGSQTVPVANFSWSMGPYGPVRLVHDGTAWLMTWTDSFQAGIIAHRGPQPEGSTHVVNVTPLRIGSFNTHVSGGTVALAWSQQETPAARYEVRLQRFAVPSTPSSELEPLHDPLAITPTATSAFPDVGIVHTSPTSMLAVWSDIRSGGAEIYAAPIDLGACP